MNIQAQPGLPLFPLISSIAAASKPEKAPDKEADAKKVATLSRGSSGGTIRVTRYLPYLQSLARVKEREIEHKAREKATWTNGERKAMEMDTKQPSINPKKNRQASNPE